MKTITQKLSLLCLVFIALSCSSDNTEETPFINTKNLTITIDENIPNGTIIGTIEAISNTNLTYTILSQTPVGALVINSSNGELSVADSSAFDFETNPEITAEISIANQTITENVNATITLNNTDDIAFVLSTSKDAYLAATDGTWISITEAEYNGLAEHLNEVTKLANSDVNYNAIGTIQLLNANYSVASNLGHTIPIGSYVFAFKYYSGPDSPTTSKVLVSTNTIYEVYSQYGSVLPIPSEGNQYYVLKNITIATESLGFLGFYFAGRVGFIAKGGFNCFENAGEAVSLPLSLDDTIMLYQGLSTTQKQW